MSKYQTLSDGSTVEAVAPLVAASVPTDGAVTVNATSTQLLAANTARISGLIKNTGTQTIGIKQGAPAVYATAFPLNPGDALTVRHQLAVNGIVSSGTGAAYVIEEVR